MGKGRMSINNEKYTPFLDFNIPWLPVKVVFLKFDRLYTAMDGFITTIIILLIFVTIIFVALCESTVKIEKAEYEELLRYRSYYINNVESKRLRPRVQTP